jgi:uncharacterized protein
MKAKSQPIAPSKRIDLIDALRGFAILGILMVNMKLFYSPLASMALGYQGSEGSADLLSMIFIKIFFEGKFYMLFSLLFGYGFYIFMKKSTTNGSSIAPVFARRINILLVFGLLHVLLLWAGDILVWYALYGFLLMAFRKVSNKGLIKWAIALPLIPITIVGFIVLYSGFQQSQMGAEYSASIAEKLQASQAFFAEATAVYSTGTFTQIMAMRIREYIEALAAGFISFSLLAAFLIGYWAARNEIIVKFKEKIYFWRKAVIVGACIGIPLQIPLVYYHLQSTNFIVIDYTTLIYFFSYIVGGFFLSLFYIASIVLLTTNGKLTAFIRFLSPVGRMALTNYLLHSIICTTIFYGYGLGMFGQFNHLQGILLTMAIFIMQIPLSWYWLKTFRYGPMEWLWRSLTYGKLQPMSKAESEEVITPAI